MIYDSSLNTYSWVRFAVESNRDAWTDPTDITPTGYDIGYKSGFEMAKDAIDDRFKAKKAYEEKQNES